jgi:hypothetical protein
VVQVALKGPSAADKMKAGLLGQRYITNPLLLFHHYKFDVRVYVLLIRSDHGYEAYFHDGYLRRCAERYYEHAEAAKHAGKGACDGDDDGVVSAFAHLSNWNMSRHHPRHDPDSDCVDGIPVRLPVQILGRANFAASTLFPSLPPSHPTTIQCGLISPHS